PGPPRPGHLLRHARRHGPRRRRGLDDLAQARAQRALRRPGPRRRAGGDRRGGLPRPGGQAVREVAGAGRQQRRGGDRRADAGDGARLSLPAMELDYAFFADTASVPPDRKLYVLGGGFRFGGADAGRSHQVELRFIDDGGKLVLPPANLQFQSAGPPPDQEIEITVPTVSYITPMFGEPGRYAAEFWTGDRLLAQVRL